jgi:ATP-binding cassette subfamily B protein
MGNKRTKISLFETVRLMGNKFWVFFSSSLIDGAVRAFFFNIAIALVSKDLFNAAYHNDKTLLYRAAFLAALSLVVPSILQPLLRRISSISMINIMNDIRQKVFKHMVQLPVSYFEKNHSGSLMSRFTGDVGAIETLFGQIGGLLFTVILGAGATVLMFFLEWHLALMSLMLGLCTVLINVLFAGPLRRRNAFVRQKWSDATECLTDIVAGFNVIKMFQIEKKLLQRYLDQNEDIKTGNMKNSVLNSLLNALNMLLFSARNIGLIVAGIFFVMNNSLEIGTIIALYQLQGNMGFMLNTVGNFVAQMQISLAGAERVIELLDEPVEPDSIELSGQDSSRSMVELHEAVFGYTDERKVLDGFNLRVEKGQVVALVGSSGGGKSTVFKLLMGFCFLEKGSMTIDGKLASAYSLAQLRDLFAYVPQESYLFEGTIEENIRYGCQNASFDDIISAAKTANAHDFIMEQPEAYQTIVGERGAKMSGGQRQRIAIARALIKNAPILLLDEATSSLDSQSEKLVQDALKKLMDGRTVIVIAHRLSTIENSDIIFVLEDGKVVEKGKHKELLANGSLYNKLYCMQYGNNAIAM